MNAAKLQADPTIDGVLTLGGQFALDAVGAVSEFSSKAKIASFDLSKDVVSDISAGTILFAVDQQPYVQGFLGVTALNSWLSLMSSSRKSGALHSRKCTKGTTIGLSPGCRHWR
jgi:ABC-type sugar transport system substrate-binding protein